MYTKCVKMPLTDRLSFTSQGEQVFINIEIERVRRYMSRADMAKALSINIDTLGDWIHKRRAIPAEGLRALSRLFEGCTLDYLLKEKS